MPSIADVLSVKAPSGSMAEPGVEGKAEVDPLGPEAAGMEGPSEEMARYAWEFKQAKDPQEAADSLEAFVRLVTGQ
jgi:hypothetical protein